MPTYEYRCPKGHEFELFQRISEAPGAPCPVCGEKAERQLSAGAGLLFKGSGFYITDYRSDSYKKAAGGESSSGSESKSSEAKPSESKAKDSGSSSAGSSGAKSGD